VVAVACESNTGGWLKDLIPLDASVCVVLFIYACQWSLASYFWQQTWSTWCSSDLVHPMPYLDGNQHVLAPSVMHELPGVMICFSCGFTLWLGSCCDPSNAWCASKGCSYPFCMLLCNITGSHMGFQYNWCWNENRHIIVYNLIV
jgi:hypothetical protein